MTDQPHQPIEFQLADEEMADGLRIGRPVPAAGFRGRLGRQLAEHDPGYGPRPERLRLLVACYLGAGGVLIAVAGLLLS
jgi:hypothetical protein